VIILESNKSIKKLFKNAKVFDVSVNLSSKTPVFPGQPAFSIEFLTQISKGDRSNVSRFVTTTHTGTHIDAPFHFINEGITVDGISFHNLIGFAKVIDFSFISKKISLSDVKELEIEKGDIILFKTRNSLLWNEEKFNREYVYITAEAADYLADRNVSTIGFDYIIPDAFADMSRPVHHALLGRNIILIEGLNLRNIPGGEYLLTCLPLKIDKSDGAPARVVLIGFNHEADSANVKV
jgi:arylformamidase